MKQKNVESKEMALRKDKDIIAAKKMGAEGGPPIHGDNIEADSKIERSKVSKSDEKA